MNIEDPEDLELIESEEEDVEESSGNDSDGDTESAHLTFDKKTGEAREVTYAQSPEGGEGGEVEGCGEEINLFQEEEAVGDSFMACKPWIGAIREPSEHPDENGDAPDEEYKLEYVFGYRAEDSRNNLYYNAEGNIVYMTACLGVILNKDENTQTFFGGNEVANAAKQHATDKNNHTNDITSIAVSFDKTLACSGQNGSKPTVFIWDATTGEKINRIVLPKGSREVSAIGFSFDNKYIATADNHNDHHVRVYEVESGEKIFEQKSGNNKVFDLEWSKKEDHYEFSTVGTKHYMVWRPLENLGKKGVYGGKGKMTSFSCVTYDENGTCYAGGSNSRIYCWRNRSLKKTYKVHGKGFVGAIKVIDGKIFSGGKDGQVIISDPNSEEVERTVEVGSLIRAIDFNEGTLLVGDRDGSIVQIDENDEITTLMKSHNDGETWGLDLLDDGRIITSGDDNKVMVWSLEERTHLAQGIVSEINKKSRKGKAASLTKHAASKCARAVAANSGGNGNVAVASNAGIITIRESVDSLEGEIAKMTDSDEWIEVLAYSPCGTMLAAGSHDNNIYIYDVEDDYSLKATCQAHNSYVTSVDWSEDSTSIRSVCGAYELLFFDSESGQQDPSGASANTDTIWATNSAKFGWLVDGIFPGNTDGTHVNHVDFSDDMSLLLTADDYGLVNIYRNPARKGHTPRSYRAHSEHVVRARFTPGGERIVSIGGYDKTIMIWQKQ
mmetsp:Transcript_14846/g.16552  ORF Transcript_14846/g.16552 Transcript_14846/m.16552 type:complete len:723 (+) Transcript_14846:49-2217(+)